MAPWLIPAIMTLGQMQQQKDQQQKEDEQLKMQMAGDRMGELGYPSYGLQAALLKKHRSERGNLGPLLAMAPMMFGGGKEPAAPKPTPLANSQTDLSKNLEEALRRKGY